MKSVTKKKQKNSATVPTNNLESMNNMEDDSKSVASSNQYCCDICSDFYTEPDDTSAANQNLLVFCEKCS